MERESRRNVFLLCFFVASLVFQSLVCPVVSRTLEGLGDQKNYYSPDPHDGNTPKYSHKEPACACPTPSHGGGYTPTPTPSHGGGYKPSPTPSTPSSPKGGCSTPTTPTTPSSPRGGGYYSPPSTPIITTPPTPVVVPVTPTPTTPVISTPPSPQIPDPNNPPFLPAPCTYWTTHPAAIWAIFGYWGTVGGFFGTPATTPFGGNPTLLQALANTRTDGIGELYREGTAAFLNSMVTKKFPFTTQQVKDAFVATVVSDKTAAAQAKLFKQANEGNPIKH